LRAPAKLEILARYRISFQEILAKPKVGVCPNISFFFEILSAGLLPVMTNPRYSKIAVSQSQIVSQSGLAQPHSSHPLLTSIHPMTNTGHQNPHVPLPMTNIGHRERYIGFL
jgi:hypothetical protein